MLGLRLRLSGARASAKQMTRLKRGSISLVEERARAKSGFLGPPREVPLTTWG
jgi:hypothetical protein